LHDTLASTGRDVLHPLRIILKERKKKLACAPLAPFEFPQLFLSLIQQHLSQGSADTLVEGLEKATRGGVNGSQSKFLNETWPMSKIDPTCLSSNTAKAT
jgi:hypothetical protein